MPERSGYIASGILHLGLVLLLLFGLPDFFRHKLPEETPLVVQLVKIGPETRATKLTKTPPQPEAKPEPVEAPPPPKPEPPKPEPKPEPPKPAPPPPQVKPPEPTPAPPEPPPPQPPQPKPVPPAPPPPIPVPKPTPPPPQPKPVPALPPPAPPPPKPTPPKPKSDPAAFDSLLKNLAKDNPDKSPPDQPKRQNSPSRPQRASSQPIAPLGSQLTASELDLVKQQIYQCWNVPVGARGADDLTPEFRVTMNSDATVRAVVLINTNRYSDPFFRAAADSARRALLNPECSPLKLPLDKYNQWQTFTITFDPKDIAG